MPRERWHGFAHLHSSHPAGVTAQRAHALRGGVDCAGVDRRGHALQTLSRCIRVPICRRGPPMMVPACMCLLIRIPHRRSGHGVHRVIRHAIPLCYRHGTRREVLALATREVVGIVGRRTRWRRRVLQEAPRLLILVHGSPIDRGTGTDTTTKVLIVVRRGGRERR